MRCAASLVLAVAACAPGPAMTVPRSTAGIAIATVPLQLSNVHVLLGTHPVLVDGEPVGAVLRVPAEAEARGNLHVGGRAVKTTLDARDRAIIAELAPFLTSHGQVLVGLDVIGGMLTELNITSPTGIRHIARLDERNVAAPILDCFERLVRTR